MVARADIITMNISLPSGLKQYIDQNVAAGMYGSASEFVREAVREKLKRSGDKTKLTEELLKGLDSGPAIEFTDDYIRDKKRALINRVGRRKSA
jgi:antitoxin ParD1/3/4